MSTIKRLPKPEFDKIYGRVPRLTVEVVILTDQEVVLTKRAIPPAIGSWHIPGGTVLMKETLEQAVARVAKEELGVKVSTRQLLGTIDYPEFWQTDYGQPVGLAYLCERISGEPRGSEQGQEVACFARLPQDVFPHQSAILQRVLAEFSQP